MQEPKRHTVIGSARSVEIDGGIRHYAVPSGRQERLVLAQVGNSARPKNLRPTVSRDGVNCLPSATRLRESRWPPPRVANSLLMGGRTVSQTVD